MAEPGAVSCTFYMHGSDTPMWVAELASVPRVGEFVSLGAGQAPVRVTIVIHELTGVQRVRIGVIR